MPIYILSDTFSCYICMSMQFNVAINSKLASRVFRLSDDMVPHTAKNLRELTKLQHGSV